MKLRTLIDSLCRFHSALIVPALLAASVACASDAFAAKAKATPTPTPTPRPRTITCPPVIGRTDDGTLYNNKGKAAGFPFQCFRTPQDAKDAGYKTPKISFATNSSRWMRLRLKMKRNTCGGGIDSGTPALFLQVNDTNQGVYGEFCPSLGSFAGVRSADGFVMTADAVISETPSSSMCDDGQVRNYQYLEVQRVIGGAAAFAVKFSIVRSCTSANSGAATCTREYTGVGFAETHPIWPAISPNVTELGASCAVALTKCKDCHSELANILP